MSCDEKKSCFYFELGKSIKIIVVISLVVFLTPSFLQNIQNFINGLNISSIKTKELEIVFNQKINEITNKVISKKDSTVEDYQNALEEIQKLDFRNLLEKGISQSIPYDILDLYSKKCYIFKLNKSEIKNYLGFEINDSDLVSYYNKSTMLLKSIDTYQGCNTSYYQPITIKIGTNIIIKDISKNDSSYSISILY